MFQKSVMKCMTGLKLFKLPDGIDPGCFYFIVDLKSIDSSLQLCIELAINDYL